MDAPPPLQIDTETRPDGTVVVRVVGEAGWKREAELEHALHAVGLADPPHVVLDLAGLAFAASTAIGALVAFQTLCNRRGRRVTLAAVRPAVGRTIAHSRLVELFTFADSVDAAVAEAETPRHEEDSK